MATQPQQKCPLEESIGKTDVQSCQTPTKISARNVHSPIIFLGITRQPKEQDRHRVCNKSWSISIFPTLCCYKEDNLHLAGSDGNDNHLPSQLLAFLVPGEAHEEKTDVAPPCRQSQRQRSQPSSSYLNPPKYKWSISLWLVWSAHQVVQGLWVRLLVCPVLYTSRMWWLLSVVWAGLPSTMKQKVGVTSLSLDKCYSEQSPYLLV